MKTHFLKIWPTFFEKTIQGKKPWEIRDSSDRKFDAGDRVVLEEWNPDHGKYTGHWSSGVIIYLQAEVMGLKDNHVCFTLHFTSSGAEGLPQDLVELKAQVEAERKGA